MAFGDGNLTLSGYLAVIACRASSIVEMGNSAVSHYRVAVALWITYGEFQTEGTHRFYNTVSPTAKKSGKYTG